MLVSARRGSREISGVVDFENAVAGDPLLDLAKTDLYARRRSDETLKALVDRYGSVRDGWREALALYSVYHVLELWTWHAFVGHHAALPSLAEDLRRRLAA